MKSFSIKELEVLCGIKAHTIRIWELRYAVFQPQRTNGNVRRYSIDELSKLSKLVLLNNSGYKASYVCKMTEGELQSVAGQLKLEHERMQRAIGELVIRMHKMDIRGFETQLDDCFLSWPPETVMDKIIFPFLSKVGLLCKGKQLSEEHLVVTAIRKKLLWSIERLDATPANAKTILLFLSNEKQLDLLLLYLYYHLKKDGWEVIYLGVNITLKNLEELLSIKQTDYLLTYLSQKQPISLDELSSRMKKLAPEAKLFVVDTGKPDEHPAYDNVTTASVSEAKELLSILGNLSKRPAVEREPQLIRDMNTYMLPQPNL
jgi:DNA-binding transcriptional MerR regulator